MSRRRRRVIPFEALPLGMAISAIRCWHCSDNTLTVRVTWRGWNGPVQTSFVYVGRSYRVAEVA